MAEDTFETFIAKERERLTKKRGDLQDRQRKIEEELGGIDKELFAIDAYEAAKQGKPPRRLGQRAPRGERRAKVLEIIKRSPNGMTRGEIIDAMGGKGDRSLEQSVSNALSALKKAGHVDSKDGKYAAPSK